MSTCNIDTVQTDLKLNHLVTDTLVCCKNLEACDLILADQGEAENVNTETVIIPGQDIEAITNVPPAVVFFTQEDQEGWLGQSFGFPDNLNLIQRLSPNYIVFTAPCQIYELVMDVYSNPLPPGPNRQNPGIIQVIPYQVNFTPGPVPTVPYPGTATPLDLTTTTTNSTWGVTRYALNPPLMEGDRFLIARPISEAGIIFCNIRHILHGICRQ